jgi:hypothetical protein
MSKILFQVRLRGENVRLLAVAGLCTSPQAFDTMETFGIGIHH